MDFLFLANSIVSFLVFLVVAFGFFKIHNSKGGEKVSEKVLYSFLFLGGFYFLFSVFYFLWGANILNFSSLDFSFLYVLFILIISVILLRVLYLYSQNKHLWFFSLFYAILACIFLISPAIKLYVFLILCFLITLLIFVIFTLSSQEYRRVGYIGIFYSILFIFIYSVFFNRELNLPLLSLIGNVIFIFIVYEFMKGLENFPVVNIELDRKNESYFSVFLRYFIFILVLTNFVFIGTVFVHEAGHFLVSSFYGCSSSKVIYETNFLHSSVLCENSFEKENVIWGGILLPFFLSFILFIVGGKFMKDISFLIAGFNFVVLKGDFVELGFSDSLVIFSFILGISFVILGIALLAISRSKDEIYSEVGF
jgi:hypothetical protein